MVSTVSFLYFCFPSFTTRTCRSLGNAPLQFFSMLSIFFSMKLISSTSRSWFRWSNKAGCRSSASATTAATPRWDPWSTTASISGSKGLGCPKSRYNQFWRSLEPSQFFIRDMRLQILIWFQKFFQTFLLFTKPHFKTFNAAWMHWNAHLFRHFRLF